MAPVAALGGVPRELGACVAHPFSPLLCCISSHPLLPLTCFTLLACLPACCLPPPPSKLAPWPGCCLQTPRGAVLRSGAVGCMAGRGGSVWRLECVWPLDWAPATAVWNGLGCCQAALEGEDSGGRGAAAVWRLPRLRHGGELAWSRGRGVGGSVNFWQAGAGLGFGHTQVLLLLSPGKQGCVGLGMHDACSQSCPSGALRPHPKTRRTGQGALH